MVIDFWLGTVSYRFRDEIVNFIEYRDARLAFKHFYSLTRMKLNRENFLRSNSINFRFRL